jgi:hypothetical protein
LTPKKPVLVIGFFYFVQNSHLYYEKNISTVRYICAIKLKNITWDEATKNLNAVKSLKVPLVNQDLEKQIAKRQKRRLRLSFSFFYTL